MNVSVKFGNFIPNGSRDIYSSEAVGCGIFDRFFYFVNCQPEAVIDVTAGMADQDVGMDVRANLGDSTLNCHRMRQFRPFFALR